MKGEMGSARFAALSIFIRFCKKRIHRSLHIVDDYRGNQQQCEMVASVDCKKF